MSDGLDVIVVDDEPSVCRVIADIIGRFYSWGEVIVFTDADEALVHCMSSKVGVAIFVVDVFLGGKNGFHFLDMIGSRFPSAHDDAIIVTGNASNDVVDMCVASGVNHLLEKPIRPFALQLAIRAIVSKYLNFAKRILKDPEFAESVSRF